MAWERFVRSAPGDVGKQHRVHPGVAVVRFPLDHSEPSLASTRPDAGMTRVVVVPANKTLRESATVLDAAKAVRELRPIL